MKTIYTAMITAAVALQAAEANDNFQNFIFQTENTQEGNPPAVRSSDLAPSGTRTGLAVGPNGSNLELWTINKLTNEDTRVDQPFTVNYTVEGLDQSDPQAPDAAKSVNFIHEVVSNGSAPVAQPSSQITQNGSTSVVKNTAIVAPDLTTANGTETFTITTLATDADGPAKELASAAVQILPIAQGSISGFDPDVSYNRFPDINVSLTDLYPTSNTYLRVLREDGSGEPIIVNTSFVSLDGSESTVSRDFTVIDINDFITEAGNYIVEVVHDTVFDETGEGIVLASMTGTKKTTIKVNGTLGGSE